MPASNGSKLLASYSVTRDQEPVGTGRRPEKNVVVLFQDDILFYTTTSYIFATTSCFTRRRPIFSGRRPIISRRRPIISGLTCRERFSSCIVYFSYCPSFSTDHYSDHESFVFQAHEIKRLSISDSISLGRFNMWQKDNGRVTCTFRENIGFLKW